MAATVKDLMNFAFLVCCSLALATTVHGINVTMVPSDLRIELQVNETVLLQFHVEGEIAGAPRSTVTFHGDDAEEEEQEWCNGARNYVSGFSSKPLVKDLSVVCDQAYWLDLLHHRQKYEVRLTNGHSTAAHIDRVTVSLEVHFFRGEIFAKPIVQQFEVIMMKSSATPTPETITTVAPPTTEKITTAAPPTKYSSSTTTKSNNQFNKAAIPDEPKIIETDSNRDESISTAPNTDVTKALPTTEGTTPTTQAAPAVSAADSFIDTLASSTQNQVTLVIGFVAALVIVVQFVVIACLAQSRRRIQTKLAVQYTESAPV